MRLCGCVCMCVHVYARGNSNSLSLSPHVCVLPKKSKEDKWHNATPFALDDQALLLAKRGGEPIIFKLLMCVCVRRKSMGEPHKEGGSSREHKASLMLSLLS